LLRSQDLAAQSLHVAHQMPGGVVLQACMRRGTAAAALVEQQHVVAGGIEETPVGRRAAAAGPAVKEDRRLAEWIAAELPIDAMAVARVQVAVRIGMDLGIHSGLAFENQIPLAMAEAQAARLELRLGPEIGTRR